MKTITITGYTLDEMKEDHPAGYDRIVQRWRDNQTEIFWTDETLDSLRAVVEKCGGRLADYQLDTEAYRSSITVSGIDDEEQDRQWFLHNVLAPLGHTRKNGHAYFPGNCALTGYCADDAFLEDTWRALNRGDTLTEALEGLSDTAARILEADFEQQCDEEAMEANWGNCIFDEDGNEIG